MYQHGGGVPGMYNSSDIFIIRSHDVHYKGFATQLSRFPTQRFGVAVFSNDEMYGDRIMDVIKFRIMDQMLGLKPIDWNGRWAFPAAWNH